MNSENSSDTSIQHIHDGNYSEILRLLSTVYWEGVEREIRELVLAYQEIEKYEVHPIPDEGIELNPGDCNFQRFCTLLTPYVEGEETFDSAALYNRAVELAQSAHLDISHEARRSRWLLQALGLLDIDVVHDGMDDVTIGRHCHDPHGEVFALSNDSRVLFREMRCEACRNPLREYFYYECNNGCVSVIPDLRIEDQEDNVIDASAIPSESRPPVRLCVACTRKDDRLMRCEREHCRKIFQTKVESKKLVSFRAKLRKSEFGTEASFYPSLKKAAHKIIDPAHFANAGPIHVALTFGPLMIENGLKPVYKVDISCRPIPSLRYEPPLMKMIYSEKDAEQETVLTGQVYDDRTHKRVVKELYQKPGRDRRVLGCVKKVCGGAFSGHNVHLADGEQEVLRSVIEAKSSFKLNAESVGWVARARSNLRTVSLPIVEAIKKTFGHEVSVYLEHFAKTLANQDIRLDWNLRENNCQTFATNLLKGLPIYGTFHHMPKAFLEDEDVRNAKDWPCPRYTMSFGSRMDTPLALLRPQPRSLIWNFYHKHRDNCDIIEFGEAYRRKPCAFPTEAWQLLDSIGDTGVAKISLVDALWSIPRDSISILHTHLLRASSTYSNTEQRVPTRGEWVQNRLRVMHQLDVFASLSGSMTAALMEQRLEKVHLLDKYMPPRAEEFGIFHAEEKIVIVGNVGGVLIYFVSGRERNWHKQETKHFIRKLRRSLGAESRGVCRPTCDES